MIKVSAWLTASEGFEEESVLGFLWLVAGVLPVSSRFLPSVSLCVYISPLYKDSSHTGIWSWYPVPSLHGK